MVHVEIFLGGETGEATIGARFQKGFVQIFPSYKFDSKLWTLKQFHFCSLDTWLDGVCQSHCPEHPWIIPTVFTGGKSIFDDEEESAGQDLGEEEEGQRKADDDNQLDQGEEIPVNNDGSASAEEEDADMIGGGDGDDDDEEVMQVKPKAQLKKAVSRTSSGSSSISFPFSCANEGYQKRSQKESQIFLSRMLLNPNLISVE